MVSVIVNIYQYYTNLTKCQGLLGYNHLHDIYAQKNINKSSNFDAKNSYYFCDQCSSIIYT